MAYSDYGGFAYKNGVREDSRSDVELSPEGLRSTPGQWPGFTSTAPGRKECFHVILGSGPIFVGLYKQTMINIFRGSERVGNLYWDEKAGLFLSRKVDGVLIEMRWEVTDNHYQYVRMIEPNGTVWTGFSGYGVGAGLEDGGHGYSTAKCVKRLENVFETITDEGEKP